MKNERDLALPVARPKVISVILLEEKGCTLILDCIREEF